MDTLRDALNLYTAFVFGAVGAIGAVALYLAVWVALTFIPVVGPSLGLVWLIGALWVGLGRVNRR